MKTQKRIIKYEDITIPKEKLAQKIHDLGDERDAKHFRRMKNLEGIFVDEQTFSVTFTYRDESYEMTLDYDPNGGEYERNLAISGPDSDVTSALEECEVIAEAIWEVVSDQCEW